MFEVLMDALSKPTVILSILFLLSAGWLMERIITRMAFMCRSVHVVHVPWGIVVVTLLVYMNGYMDYKGVVLMGLFYLISYPSMWYLNYRFSKDLDDILRKKHVTRETAEMPIWPEEVRWIWQVKRQWRKVVRKQLDEQIVDWIVDYDNRNGISCRYGIPIPTKERDN